MTEKKMWEGTNSLGRVTTQIISDFYNITGTKKDMKTSRTE
jgi:hypothetical protein